jgi:hypothetical protein
MGATTQRNEATTMKTMPEDTGAFAVSSPYAWNLLNVDTTGQVTLTAVPEPATFVMLMFAAAGCCVWRRHSR